MPVKFDLYHCAATVAFVIAAAIVFLPASGSGKTLHTFRGASDGSVPQAGLLADQAGNLYGTTLVGGGGTDCSEENLGCGVVFEISNAGVETILHAFAGGCDGAFPQAGLINDSQNNLYGTTDGGGICNSDSGYGIVFRLAPGGAETVLYSFQGTTDGSAPYGNLVSDKNGNLYGTTEAGGTMSGCEGFGCGVIFEVTPSGEESVLHAFQGGADGSFPMAGLMMDGSGNLFGTTLEGGGSSNCSAGCGTVFEVALDGTETVLYAFQGATDGWSPISGLIADASGNLYGTTAAVGSGGRGTVFEVTSRGAETILHSFQDGTDGVEPYGGLVMDGAGNLYGTTYYGSGIGCKEWGGCGTIFEVTAKGREKVLYAFKSSHGRNPAAGLLLGARGDLYGTTTAGGKGNNGVVFELKK